MRGSIIPCFGQLVNQTIPVALRTACALEVLEILDQDLMMDIAIQDMDLMGILAKKLEVNDLFIHCQSSVPAKYSIRNPLKKN